MQDDQFGRKFEVLAQADMARITPSMIIKNIFGSKQPSLSAGTRYTYFKLALLYKENRLFTISASF
jgi:hypothetical protein